MNEPGSNFRARIPPDQSLFMKASRLVVPVEKMLTRLLGHLVS